METKINKSYQELKNLGSTKPYPIVKIEWWLMKFTELYTECKKSYYLLCGNCKVLECYDVPYDCIDKPEYCNKKEFKKQFLDLYEVLDSITQVHRYYDECAFAYNHISTDLLNRSDLTIKYAHLWNSLHNFYSEYIEEDKEYIYVMNIPNTDFEIRLLKKQFRLIYTFYEYYGKVCSE